jgi:hypothetical protein
VKENLKLVVAYHERAKRLTEALNKKHAQRSELIEKAKGIDSLSLERQFDYQDLDAAGKAIREILVETPEISVAALQDLVGERAVVSEDVVVASLWEQVQEGNVRWAGGDDIKLIEREQTIG